MQLIIRSQESHLFEANDVHTVADLKAFVAETENISAEEQLLYSCGKPLSDDSALVSAAVEGGLVEVTIRVRGGKVHGSLARAGKVKGQTPKVEKQEKKKKKTGRAKRRIQYNRRFVNVVQGFGKRRGPNANS